MQCRCCYQRIAFPDPEPAGPWSGSPSVDRRLSIGTINPTHVIPHPFAQQPVQPPSTTFLASLFMQSSCRLPRRNLPGLYVTCQAHSFLAFMRPSWPFPSDLPRLSRPIVLILPVWSWHVLMTRPIFLARLTRRSLIFLSFLLYIMIFQTFPSQEILIWSEVQVFRISILVFGHPRSVFVWYIQSIPYSAKLQSENRSHGAFVIFDLDHLSGGCANWINHYMNGASNQ